MEKTSLPVDVHVAKKIPLLKSLVTTVPRAEL